MQVGAANGDEETQEAVKIILVHVTPFRLKPSKSEYGLDMVGTEPGSSNTSTPPLPEGLVVFVKQDCQTCELVEPVLEQLEAATGLTVFTQDEPSFPASVTNKIFDSDLSVSWHHDIETVPTVLLIKNGRRMAETVGWSRSAWEKLTDVGDLGEGLPEQRPGCGSLSVDPNLADELTVRFSTTSLQSRRVEFAQLEDEHEAMFSRGWSDGLPVVPPTEAKVLAMLEATSLEPDEIVAVTPPDLIECTAEKAAINAVLAGCRPDYFPVVLAGLRAICNDRFNMHGVLATTMPVGPVFVVNGPIRHRIGMNSELNVFGQGNRANLTIGRAIQLIIRNVGGGRPGEVDRAALGQPGKISFCFAENEETSPWEPLSVAEGFEPGEDVITAFPGEAPRSVVDQLSRDPESLARSLASCLLTVHHPKIIQAFDAILAIAPDHARVFREAQWTRDHLIERITEYTTRPGTELIRGAGGIAEGIPEKMADSHLAKFRPGGLKIVHCGGGAGLFSAIIGGWGNGATGSDPVSVAITP